MGLTTEMPKPTLKKGSKQLIQLVSQNRTQFDG